MRPQDHTPTRPLVRHEVRCKSLLRVRLQTCGATLSICICCMRPVKRHPWHSTRYPTSVKSDGEHVAIKTKETLCNRNSRAKLNASSTKKERTTLTKKTQNKQSSRKQPTPIVIPSPERADRMRWEPELEQLAVR